MKKLFALLAVALLPACSWLASHPEEVKDLEQLGKDAVKAAEDAVMPPVPAGYAPAAPSKAPAK